MHCAPCSAPYALRPMLWGVAHNIAECMAALSAAPFLISAVGDDGAGRSHCCRQVAMLLCSAPHLFLPICSSPSVRPHLFLPICSSPSVPPHLCSSPSIPPHLFLPICSSPSVPSLPPHLSHPFGRNEGGRTGGDGEMGRGEERKTRGSASDWEASPTTGHAGDEGRQGRRGSARVMRGSASDERECR
ncbi:unnamed protein product [Closterium sp. NIES-65]|nr:unnamed protein product [Closterium sp. NIES-65]